MKLTSSSFTVICLILFLSACSKKDKVVSKTELLTSGSWIITVAESDDDGNGTYETNDYLYFPPCFKDNYYSFKTNGQAELNEGPTKCDVTDPQTETTTWMFTNNEANLVLDSDTYEIIELSNSTLRLKLDYGAGRSSRITMNKR